MYTIPTETENAVQKQTCNRCRQHKAQVFLRSTQHTDMLCRLNHCLGMLESCGETWRDARQESKREMLVA